MLTSLIIFTFFQFARSAPANNDAADLKKLEQTIFKIKNAEQVDFIVERVTQSEFTGEKTATGSVSLSKDLFAIDITSVPKEKIIYDGKTLWVAQYPDPAFPGPVQVIQTHLSGKQREKAMLSDLLAQGKILKAFDLKKTASGSGQDKKLVRFIGTPKEKNGELKEILITIEKDQIKSLMYKDEIDNSVHFNVIKQKILKQKIPSRFQFTPPKGSQVSRI